MVQVGIGHRRVLAHHVHAADLLAQRGVHDLDHGQPALRVERHAPQLLELGLRLRIVDELVVGVHHRDQAGIGRALHVVLSAQRMQPAARLADLPGHQAQRDQAACIVGAVHVLRDAHAPEDHRSLRGGEGARDLADGLRVDAAHRRHRLRAVAFDVLLQVIVAERTRGDETLVDQPLVHDHVHHGIEQGDVGVGLELQRPGRMAREFAAARIGDDQPGTVLHRILDPGRGHRMVHRRVGADHQHHVGMDHVVDLVRHRSRAQPFEQRGHGRGMAQAGAVVDVVAAEAGAYQLLEQVGLLVRALGRPEAGQRLAPERVANGLQLRCREVERLFPGGFAEHRQRVAGVHREIGMLADAFAADQWRGQALLVVHIVETVATLHAQPFMVRRAVAAVDREDPVVLDVVGELAADAAERADRMDLPVRHLQADFARGHQCAGRAGLHAFAAGHATAVAHRVVEVERNLRMVAAERIADHVVHLLFPAGAHAAGALDAGVEVDRDARVRQVGGDLRPRSETGQPHVELARPVVEFGIERMGLRRHVGQQQLEHHLLRLHGARAVGLHVHAGLGRAAARRRQYPLALDLDHAGPAIAIRPHARLVAQARNLHAQPVGHLDQRLVGERGDRAAVQRELDLVARGDRL